MSSGSSANDTATLNWLELDYEENLHQHSTAQLDGLLGTNEDGGGATRTLALFSERIVDDEAEVNDLFLFSDYVYLI